jgi:uncharacterized coiled-coil protein SlyX
MTHDQDVELHERVARIEIEVEHIDKVVSERHGHLQRIEDKLDAVEKDLDRYRGTVGAILLVLGAITTFFKLFWHDITKFFKL